MKQMLVIAFLAIGICAPQVITGLLFSFAGLVAAILTPIITAPFS